MRTDDNYNNNFQMPSLTKKVIITKLSNLVNIHLPPNFNSAVACAESLSFLATH